MSDSKDILIFGGTGAIGQYITQAILDAKPSFDKVAIFTSPSTVENKKEQLEKWKGQGLKVIVGDLTKDEDVLGAYEGFDTVVSAVGRNVIAEQINLIKLAEATPSINRFFPSEYGTDIEYSPESANEKPHQLKLKVRAYIKDNVKRLQYTYLVTGPYSDMFITDSKIPEYGTFDVKNKSATLLGTGNENISFTTQEDVGKLLVASLRHPDESRNKALKVNSFTTTGHQIVAEFEKQTGEKWSVSYTSLDHLKELEQNAWNESKPIAHVYTLRRIWTQGGTLYDKIDNDLIAAPEPDTLEKAVAQSMKAQA